MSSPLPPDPYAALGVAKDVEFSAIRSAYRKLALLHHPDRIKDEALREKGKDEFQKIQRAWEILGDAEKRQRYDDRVRLAELRKEAMMRDSPQRAASTATYAPRPSPASQAPHTTNTREYREDGNYFEEVRQPRNVPTYDEPYSYDEPSRTNSRKYPEYEKRAPAPKSEKKTKAASSFAAAGLAAQFASKLRTQAAEKSKSSRADEKKSDREKRRERTEKVQTRRSPYAADYSSDSDHTEIRPSLRPSSRSKTTSDYPRTKAERPRDQDEESFDSKWEKHHDDVKAYISKATNRPSLDRSGSDAYQYWAGNDRKSGSDNEKRPNSSKGRRAQDDHFVPSFAKATSSPSNLRAHVEERAPPRSTVGVSRDREHRDRDRERDRDRGRDKDRDHDRDREHRKVVPPLSRSHTTPMPRSTSKKDSAPSKGSNLRHTEAHVHDSSYSSSSSPQTPEMREQSPPRTSKGRHTSTKYQVNIDPEIVDAEGARAPRITKIYPDEDRYPRYHSPEPISREAYGRETDRRSRDKPERPKVDTSSRSKSSRGAAMMQEMAAGAIPPVRRGDSGHHNDSRASPRSPRDTPPLSRHDSGREKMFMEVSPEDRYNRPYPAEKVNVAPRRDASAAKYANYSRDGPDLRESEYRTRFTEQPFRARRPSVY